MKLKICQKVECMDNTGAEDWLEIGKVYKILKIYDRTPDIFIKVRKDCGGWHIKRFYEIQNMSES